jgi:uncharacterized protein
MDYLFKELTSKKIGEIAIIGPPDSAQEPFIHSICKDVSNSYQDIIFGRLDFARELSLFVYGIRPNDGTLEFSWDLIAQKILGFIVLFDWYDEQSFENSKKILDFLSQQFDAPILLAADVRERPYPTNRNIFQDGISLDVHRKLTFCSSSDPKSSKRIFISLINSVINKLP